MGTKGKKITKQRRRFSLRAGMYAIVLVCWVVPLVATLLISNDQLTRTVRSRIVNTITASAEHGMDSVTDRFSQAIADSKDASYDGQIRRYYEKYHRDALVATLYQSSQDYLARKYSYSRSFNATYLYYNSLPDMILYVGSDTQDEMRRFWQLYSSAILEISNGLGTRTRFVQVGESLYMVRNIVDSDFSTYAVLVNKCNLEYLLEGLTGMVWAQDVTACVDGAPFRLLGRSLKAGEDQGLRYNSEDHTFRLDSRMELDGHKLELWAVLSGELLAEEQANYHVTFFIMVAVSGLLFLMMIHFFSRNISRPVTDLVEAMEHLEHGELGYHTAHIPGNQEFAYLTLRFNELSDQMKEYFERKKLEQEALHEARIKALQSQINPHFLNNTLELINWEARMEGNESVCKMIEALSVMLNAAMARGGRATVNMREEFSYIDAYLYIISQRFGARLSVTKEIEPRAWEAEVPRLILQPIVENAIEHGASHLSSCHLRIHLHLDGPWLLMDVEHDGRVSPEDRALIDQLLTWDGGEQSGAAVGSARIGIRNVNQRLKMLCGTGSGLSIEEYAPGQVRSRIRLPFVSSSKNGEIPGNS